jgi:hypothetical protein
MNYLASICCGSGVSDFNILSTVKFRISDFCQMLKTEFDLLRCDA